jgi:hypothetical protein
MSYLKLLIFFLCLSFDFIKQLELAINELYVNVIY